MSHLELTNSPHRETHRNQFSIESLTDGSGGQSHNPGWGDFADGLTASAGETPEWPLNFSEVLFASEQTSLQFLHDEPDIYTEADGDPV